MIVYTTIYSVHIQLPKLAKELQEELADLYNLDTTIKRKDTGQIYVDFEYDLDKGLGPDENTIRRLYWSDVARPGSIVRS